MTPDRFNQIVEELRAGLFTSNVVQPTVAPPIVAPTPTPSPISTDGKIYYEWNWATAYKVTTFDTVSHGRMTPNGIVVIGFNIPQGPDKQAGNISLIEYPGDTVIAFRTVVISKIPGDLSGSVPWKNTGVNPSVAFSIGEVFPTMWAPLTPGRWYINIANRNLDDKLSCGPDSGANYPRCDLRITLTKPVGY